MAQPMRPEPKYFLNESLDYQEYLARYFSPINSESTILGEKSTSYYENEEVAKRISALIPQAKLIFVLRNPIDRAFSNYKFSLQHGLETRSLKEVFIDEKLQPDLKNDVSVNPFNYLGRGAYMLFIESYLNHFRDDQLKVCLFERITQGDGHADLCEFLGISLLDIHRGNSDQVNASTPLSDHDTEDVRHRLKEYFSPMVNELSEYLNIDLRDYWKDFK